MVVWIDGGYFFWFVEYVDIDDLKIYVFFKKDNMVMMVERVGCV